MGSLARRPWFEAWGEVDAQNRLLKCLLLFLVVLFVAQTVALVVLSLRKPTLFAISPEISTAIVNGTPGASTIEAERERRLRRYVQARHQWTPSTVEKQLTTALAFISDTYREQFEKDTTGQSKLVVAKGITQRVHITSLTIDDAANTAKISADRVIRVDGVRAVTPFNLEIKYELGDRTIGNPEGLYITSEKQLEGEKL